MLRPYSIAIAVASLVLSLHPVGGQSFPPESVRFFESSIRPVLVGVCSECHNDQVRTSGLSVASREALLHGGRRGPAISVESPSESLLLVALGHDRDLRMPPSGRLSGPVVQAFSRWLELGAPWPAALAGSRPASGPRHWSFQAVRLPRVPAEQDSRAASPIDSFVLARLADKGLGPAPEARRETLVRRLYLDLTGLLPSPEQASAFVQDTRPDAYGRLVDHLLASPRYGERWGRHWLDVARYADSNGYNADAPRSIWMYRDWVIDALNRDLPFDRFAVEQLAGDLLVEPTTQQLVATGFHRNTLLNLEGGVDFEQYRVEAVVDRVSVTGTAFLGLTLGCARCHDHKYDPISQQEFYEFLAFFNNIDELSGEFSDGEGRGRAYEPLLEFGTDEQYARRDALKAQLAVMQEELDVYEKALRDRQPEWEAGLTDAGLEQLPLGVQRELARPPSEREPGRLRFITNAFLAQDPGIQERRRATAAVRKLLPDIPSTLVMRELPEPRTTHIHEQGDFLRRGERVWPGTPAVLPPFGSGPASRLGLARWIVSPDNPLTPRVTANRIWQRYFGKGIVPTENDFGIQGERPSHPLLLDWLAAELVQGDWSLKSLHRRIVTSATYRQASDHRRRLAALDPSNILLGRQNRLRVESEIVRDVALSASGLLDSEIGGPSVFPAQPEGVMIRQPWPESSGRDRFRRGLYTHFWRTSPHPGLIVFDSPDALTLATRRNRSNTPLQALTLLNDTGFQEFAQGLARRVLRDLPAAGLDARCDRLLRVCLGRSGSAMEMATLRRLVQGQLDEFTTHPERADPVLTLETAGSVDRAEAAAWTVAAGVVMNLDEFITRE